MIIHSEKGPRVFECTYSLLQVNQIKVQLEMGERGQFIFTRILHSGTKERAK